MSFEQHPELFWGIVCAISIAGGYLGSTLRHYIKKVRSWKSNRV